MADINKEIVSFEVDADVAATQVDNYIKKLELLEREQQQLQKAGKDTAAVQSQISSVTQKLNKVLADEVTTQKALQKQTEALTKANNVLNKTQKDNAVATEKVSTNNAKLATSLARASGRATNLGGALALGVGGLASFAGAAELSGVALGVITAAASAAFSALNDYLFPVNRATELSKELASEYIKEGANLAQLSNIITDTTTSTDDRTRAINALNAQYKDYLPALLTEKSTNEEVAAAIRLANDALLDKIILQAREKEAFKQVEIITQKSIELANLNTDASLKRNKFLVQGAATFTATALGGVLGGFLANTETAANATGEAVEAATRASIQSTIDAANENLANLDKTFVAVKENLKTVKLESLAAASGVTKSSLKQAEIAEKNSDKLAEQKKKEKKATDAAAGSLAALEKKLQDLSKLINETPLSDEQLIQLGGAYQKLQKDVENARQKVAELKGEIEAQKLVEIDASRIGKINRVETNALIQQEKDIKAEIAIIDADTTTNTNQQRQNALDRLQLEINLLNTEKQRLETQKQSTAELDKQIAGLIQEEAQLAALVPLQNQQEAQQRQITALEIEQIKAQSDPQRLAIEKQVLDLKIAELETQRQILAIQGQNTLEVDKQIAQLQAQKAQVDVDAAKERGEKIKQNFSAILDGVADIANQTTAFLSAVVQSQIGQIDAAIQRTESNLQGLLDSQETVSAQQVQIEQERLDKLQAQREKAVEREAIISKAQIAAATAVTIARAAAEGGGIGSAITIAAALASLVFGFAQAQIAADNAFYEGSLFVPLGKNPKGRDTIPARLHEGEAVIPAKTNKEYHPAIKAIYKGTIPAQAINDFASNWANVRAQSPSLNTIQIAGVYQSGQNVDNNLLQEIAQNTANKSETKVLITAQGIAKITTNKQVKRARLQSRNQ